MNAAEAVTVTAAAESAIKAKIVAKAADAGVMTQTTRCLKFQLFVVAHQTACGCTHPRFSIIIALLEVLL